MYMITPLNNFSLSVGAVEYADCTFAMGYPPMRLPVGCGGRPIMLEEGIMVAEKSMNRQLKR